MAPTLLLDAGFLLAMGLIYAYVGALTWRRKTGGEAQLASDLFATWWFALAASTATTAATRVLGFAGVTQPAAYVALTLLGLLAVCIALWGLLYYLLYLFTGRRRVLVLVSAFYSAFFAWIVYLTSARPVTGVAIGAWKVEVLYAGTLAPGVLTAFVVLLALPPVLGAFAYARLYFRVEETTQRYRIGLVAGTIVVWFSATLVAYAFGATGGLAWQLGSRLIALGASALLYFAYRPPAWVRRRYGVRALDEPGTG